MEIEMASRKQQLKKATAKHARLLNTLRIELKIGI